MNTVIFAPQNDLSFADAEVSSVALALRAVVISGPQVTRQRVVETIRAGKWAVLWFACHGNGDGIQLSDGILSASEITQDARNAGASLVVLNSCSSEDIAYRIHNELRIDVICTVAEVADAMAYRTGVYLARNLANGLSVRDAYEMAKPGQNRLYLYLTDGGERREDQIITLINQLVTTVHARFDSLEDHMAEEIASLRKDLGELKAVSLTYHPVRRAAWVMGAMLFATPMIVEMAIQMQLHGIDWTLWVPPTILTLALSITLLMFGLGFWRA